MKVLVTRAEPAASRTVQKLRHHGFEPVLLPIFELKDTGTPLPEGGIDGVIFTSANAAEILRLRQWRDSNRSAVAYCVGPRTAEAAQALGFEATVTASGGGAALADEIAALDLPQDTQFLYPTTPDRSFDMKQAIEALGHSVSEVEIYHVEKLVPPALETQDALAQCKNGAILVYSARSAAHLASIIEACGASLDISSVSIVAISKTAINMLLNFPWQNAYVSKSPDEDAMIAALERLRQT